MKSLPHIAENVNIFAEKVFSTDPFHFLETFPYKARLEPITSCRLLQFLPPAISTGTAGVEQNRSFVSERSPTGETRKSSSAAGVARRTLHDGMVPGGVKKWPMSTWTLQQFRYEMYLLTQKGRWKLWYTSHFALDMRLVFYFHIKEWVGPTYSNKLYFCSKVPGQTLCSIFRQPRWTEIRYKPNPN